MSDITSTPNHYLEVVLPVDEDLSPIVAKGLQIRILEVAVTFVVHVSGKSSDCL
jgi:hypothetical protein